MFHLLRRVSGSLLPRPDRPWRDDATSHAPTIGRKRRYSVTERDDDDSVYTAKRTKDGPVEPDAEHGAASDEESTKEASVDAPEVKEVTEGVKEVVLEDKDNAEDPSSAGPAGVPLPDSRPGSPESDPKPPAPTRSNPVEETKDREQVDDKGSVTSSAPKDDAEEKAETEPVTVHSDAFVGETTSVQEVTIVMVEPGLHDVPESLKVMV